MEEAPQKAPYDFGFERKICPDDRDPLEEACAVSLCQDNLKEQISETLSPFRNPCMVTQFMRDRVGRIKSEKDIKKSREIPVFIGLAKGQTSPYLTMGYKDPIDFGQSWEKEKLTHQFSPKQRLSGDSLIDQLNQFYEFYERFKRLVKETEDQTFQELLEISGADSGAIKQKIDEHIKSSIEEEDTKKARKFINLALNLFPDTGNYKIMQRILSPPKIIKTNESETKGIQETISFLKKFGQKFLNKWVAISCGELLGSSDSYAELAKIYGHQDVIITKVV
jgi:hypothetical protein